MKTLWLMPALAVLAATFAGCGGGAGNVRPLALTPAVTAPAAASAPAPASVQQQSSAADPSALTYISKAAAEKIALAAVHGGIVTLAVLERSDLPVHWSIDITKRTAEYEVWVDARTGKVLAIIKGG